DRARRAVHEPFHARFLGRDHEGLETIVVDGLRELLIELEACVVGDAGEMKDGVLTDKRLGELGRVADVALDDPQMGRIGQPAPKKNLVKTRKVAPLEKQPWGEEIPNIASTAGNQHILHSERTPFLKLMIFSEGAAWRTGRESPPARQPISG